MLTPPEPCTSTVSPGLRSPNSKRAFHAVKAAVGSVAASSMTSIGNPDEAALMPAEVFGKDAIDRSTERRLRLLGFERTCCPIRHLCRGDAVAELKAIDRAPDFDYLARAVGERHKGQADVTDSAGDLPQCNQEVAVVQRCRVHANANFVMSEGQERPLNYPQVFQSESIYLCDEIRLLLRRTSSASPCSS